MNTKQTLAAALSLALAFAASARLTAQTAASAPPPPAPAPYAAPAPTADNWQFDVSTPYAFKFHTAGIVGDAGGFWNGNFFGGELSYYNAREHSYPWYSPAGAYQGQVPYREHLTTLNLAYRYSFGLPVPGWAGSGTSPLEAYVGGSAGLGWLEYYPNNYNAPFPGGPGYSDDNKGRFDFNLVGGLQWNFTPNIGVKAGYRYLDVESAHRFYSNNRIDSGAVEGGVVFRF